MQSQRRLSSPVTIKVQRRQGIRSFLANLVHFARNSHCCNEDLAISEKESMQNTSYEDNHHQYMKNLFISSSSSIQNIGYGDNHYQYQRRKTCRTPAMKTITIKSEKPRHQSTGYEDNLDNHPPVTIRDAKGLGRVALAGVFKRLYSPAVVCYGELWGEDVWTVVAVCMSVCVCMCSLANHNAGQGPGE